MVTAIFLNKASIVINYTQFLKRSIHSPVFRTLCFLSFLEEMVTLTNITLNVTIQSWTFIHLIAQFRIPGRTGSSYAKTHQSEADAGKK